MSGMPTDGEPEFEGYPKLKEWQQLLDAATKNFGETLDRGSALQYEEALAHGINALTQYYLAIGSANDGLGINPSQKTIHNRIKKKLHKLCKREIESGECRAIATAIFYDRGIRNSDSGARDTPLESAMRAAAKYLGVNSIAPETTMRQSIQRFRKKFRNEKLFTFDEITLEVRVVPAAEVLMGMMIGKPGRRKKT